MTSTQEQIDLSYSVSNEFFKLWLDENMHYTCAVYTDDDAARAHPYVALDLGYGF